MRCRLRRPGGWRAASAGSDGQLVRSTAGRPAIFRRRPALALAALPATATVAAVRRQAHLPWRWRTIVVGVAFGARVRTHPGQYWQTPTRRQSHFFCMPCAAGMPDARMPLLQPGTSTNGEARHLSKICALHYTGPQPLPSSLVAFQCRLITMANAIGSNNVIRQSTRCRASNHRPVGRAVLRQCKRARRWQAREGRQMVGLGPQGLESGRENGLEGRDHATRLEQGSQGRLGWQRNAAWLVCPPVGLLRRPQNDRPASRPQLRRRTAAGSSVFASCRRTWRGP